MRLFSLKKISAILALIIIAMPFTGLQFSKSVEASVSYKFPWADGTSKTWWGSTDPWHGGHDANCVNQTGSPSSCAIDFGGTGSWEVLSMAAGSVNVVCEDDSSKQTVNIEITDANGVKVRYFHIKKSTLNSSIVKDGAFIQQGTKLGNVWTGGLSADCQDGKAYQTSSSGHVHLIIPTYAFNIDGWVFDYPSSCAVKDGVSKCAGASFVSTNKLPTNPKYADGMTFDFDNDGLMDLSALKGADWYIDYASNGLGSWDEIVIKANYSRDNGWIPVAGDYNNDGFIDIAVAGNVSGQLVWFIDYYDNGFNDPENRWDNNVWKGGYGTGWQVVSDDYDFDGILDLAIAGNNGGNLMWLIDFGANGYTSKPQVNWDTTVTKNGYGTGWQVVSDDYDNDGKLDLAIFGNNGGDAMWLIDYGGNNYTSTPQVNWDSSYLKNGYGTGWKPVAGDYDNDGELDIAIFGNNSGRAMWLIDYSANGITRKAEPNWEDESLKGGYGTGWQVVSGDYDNDGTLDLALFGDNSGAALWMIDYGYDGFLNIPGPNWNTSYSL